MSNALIVFALICAGGGVLVFFGWLALQLLIVAPKVGDDE